MTKTEQAEVKAETPSIEKPHDIPADWEPNILAFACRAQTVRETGRVRVSSA